VLDPYGEVVRPAGELDERGMSLRAIDQQFMTRELVAAGFGRRLILRDIDRTAHVWIRRVKSAAGLSDTNSRSDDDGIVVESLSTAARHPIIPSQSPNDCGARRDRLYSAHAV
jgi:hypothetical protein